MKKTVKRKPKPRVRRNPFARALEVADRKLEKASHEYARCQNRLVVLGQEIPKLIETKHVLESQLGRDHSEAPNLDIEQQAGPSQKMEPLSPRKPSGPPPNNVMDIVPKHLLHMVVPKEINTGGAYGRVVGLDNSEEDGLSTRLPGTELLP